MEASIGEVLVSVFWFSSKSASLNTRKKSHCTMNLSTYLNSP